MGGLEGKLTFSSAVATAAFSKFADILSVALSQHFISLGSKITADGDCSHETKRHLLLGRKVMTKLDSILKSRDIMLSTKVH